MPDELSLLQIDDSEGVSCLSHFHLSFLWETNKAMYLRISRQKKYFDFPPIYHGG